LGKVESLTTVAHVSLAYKLEIATSELVSNCDKPVRNLPYWNYGPYPLITAASVLEHDMGETNVKITTKVN